MISNNLRTQSLEQSTVMYQLTDQDLLQLYALYTPNEIIEEFSSKRCRSAKSIYNLIHRYRLDRPLQARKFLEKIIIAACPETKNFNDWESLVHKNLAYVRALAFQKMWQRINKHESLFDEL